MIHIAKGFGIVNNSEIDVFLELSCFLNDPADAGNLISGSSAFSKTSLNIRKFMVHVLLEHIKREVYEFQMKFMHNHSKWFCVLATDSIIINELFHLIK